MPQQQVDRNLNDQLISLSPLYSSTEIRHSEKSKDKKSEKSRRESSSSTEKRSSDEKKKDYDKKSKSSHSRCLKSK